MTVKEFYKKIQDTARKASVDTAVQAFIFQQGLSQEIMARVDIEKWNRLGSNDLNGKFSVAEQAEKHLLEISTHNKSKKGGNSNVCRISEDMDDDCPLKAVKLVGGKQNKQPSRSQNAAAKGNRNKAAAETVIIEGEPLYLPPGRTKYRLISNDNGKTYYEDPEITAHRKANSVCWTCGDISHKRPECPYKGKQIRYANQYMDYHPPRAPFQHKKKVRLVAECKDGKLPPLNTEGMSNNIVENINNIKINKKVLL